MRFLKAAILALAVMGLAPSARADDAPLADWAGIFIAADWRAHSGAPTEVFDNGRRDLAKGFVAAGLKPENTVQFSVRPELYATTPERPFGAKPETLRAEIDRVTAQAKSGCVFFLTSHGSPRVVVLGDAMLTPAALASLLNETCGERPTVVILSACFSGSFIPALAGPNRLVMTAARHDRSSFGCGESNVYTYFDGCLLDVLPLAGRLDVLGERTRACVEKREQDMNLTPASEPQMTIGAQMEAALPGYLLKQGKRLAR